MESQLYEGFHSSQRLVDEFNMLQDNQPISFTERDSSDEESTAEESQELKESKQLPAVHRSTVVVRNIDVLNHIFGTLSGKDRLAKILKYVLDLVKLFVSRSRIGITRWDPQVLEHYSKVLTQLNLRLLLRHPATIAKIMVVAGLRNFEAKASLVSSNLSLFRQILRFGGTPFRVAALWSKINLTTRQIAAAHAKPISTPDSHILAVINKLWLNEASLADFIDLYYGVMDELMLLHKFKVWHHPGMYTWVAKHESLSWYYDIMLGLKKNWCALQQLNHTQLELSIQEQVKKRALELSSRLQGKTASPIKQQLLQDLQTGQEHKDQFSERLRDIERQRKVIILDLVRLSFDFLADTTDVFNLKTPPGTYAVLSLASGITGFVKLWGNAKRELSESIV
ncbi:LAQU0S01e07492g1_1 [Lachancea quebecensis]|uniref:LAQU0S01e07492g1_1 n=1 Tax=Lachancea quebecensis TaxID=1654605 RepID=A0A0N7MKU8_9SACH|nr:LAQU0S01e07492g1_1 [Lachancea quebecensis]